MRKYSAGKLMMKVIISCKHSFTHIFFSFSFYLASLIILLLQTLNMMIKS